MADPVGTDHFDHRLSKAGFTGHGAGGKSQTTIRNVE